MSPFQTFQDPVLMSFHEIEPQISFLSLFGTYFLIGNDFHYCFFARHWGSSPLLYSFYIGIISPVVVLLSSSLCILLPIYSLSCSCIKAVLVDTVPFWSIGPGVWPVTKWTKFEHRPPRMWPGTGSKFCPRNCKNSPIKGLVMPSLFLSSKNHLSQASMVPVTWDMCQISARTTGPVMHDGPIDQNGTVYVRKCHMQIMWHTWCMHGLVS